MATEILELVVRTNGATTAANEIKGIGTAAAGVKDSLAFMRNALVALSFARAFTGILEAVSAFQQINNQLRVITASTEEAAAAQNTVKQLSIETRTSYTETAFVFASIARGTSSLALNWGQITQLTRAFNESLAISGANTAQARNSMRDFIELLNLGVVQGRNFRALLMQDPALVNAVATTIVATGAHAKQVNDEIEKIRAQGKNISGGGLFELTKKFPGSFTSDDFVRAIESQKLLQEQWKNTKETVGQALEILKTQFEDTIGRMAMWITGAEGVAHAINDLGDNLPQILLVVGAFITLVALNTAISALVGILGTLGTVFRMLTSGFTALISVARAFYLLVISEAGLLVLPFILLGTVVGIVLYKAFDGLAQKMGGWGEFALKLITTIGGEFVEAFEHPMEAFQAFLGVVLEGINLMLRGLSNMVNAGIDAANKVNPFGQIGHVDFTFKNPLTDAMDQFAKGTTAKANSYEKTIKDAWAKFTTMGTPGSGLDPNAKPSVGATSNVEEAKKAHEAALASLERLIAKYEPAAAAAARYAETVKIFTAAEKVGINVSVELAKWGLTKEELLKREERAAIGAGNAETDYTGRIRELNVALKANNISQAESNHLKDAAKIKLMESRFDASSGVTAAELKERLKLTNEQAIAQSIVTKAYANTNALKDYAIAQIALKQAVVDGTLSQRDATKALEDYQIAALQTKDDVQSGIDIAMIKFNQTLRDQNTIAQGAVKAALSNAEAQNTFSVSMDAVNKLYQQGVIDIKRYTESVQDLELTLLKTKTDALSGFQAGMIEVQKTMADSSKDASKVVTDAFNNMTDALTNFFMTGKLNMSTFVNSILADLTRLAVKQAIMAPLANMLGFGAGGTSSGGGGITSFLGSMFGGGGGGGIFGGSSAASAGGLGGLFGAAGGADFDVGGMGGTDSQLLAMRVSPGEHVSVKTPTQSKSGGGATINLGGLHLHGVSDPDSFHRSRGQTMAGIERMITRAAIRNSIARGK